MVLLGDYSKVYKYKCMNCNKYFNDIDFEKEQEPIKPYLDYDGRDVWRCGKCGNTLFHPSYCESDEDEKNHIRYCSHCGMSVKWDKKWDKEIKSDGGQFADMPTMQSAT